jgi:hypothetical protein
MPNVCVGCLMLDPDLTPHQNMTEAYELGYHDGAGHPDGPGPCPKCYPPSPGVSRDLAMLGREA